ncbi:cation/H(+) antiporter 2 isoform X2 [Ricinus communis]|uniref:cation/H(+) antiporter 2 isoform X2 n=1 Tax=Ricinus communis TaxID=3988 RepID=UPI0007727297|nr:cation/H(+) antiporter 2 isoform X2 [Ricinus communis]|eukprot:XP_015582697.1 cation/H(+) antiporter 2 isoform X2 [Ricinus communis]
MDAAQIAKRAICQEDPFNPLITTGMQVACMLVISHIFHLILAPSGQTGPIANIIAGLVLGPSLLCRIKQLKEFFIQSSSIEYYQVLTFNFRVFFMFLIGLDTDVPYMKRNLRLSSTVAYGGIIICTLFGGASAFFILHLLKFKYNTLLLVMIIPLILANSASPVVIRLAAEMKIDTSDVGRLGIASSLVNEMSCVLLYSIFISVKSWKMFGHGILCLFCIVVLVILNKYLATWFNKRNQNQKYVSNTEVLVVFILVIAIAMVIEAYGFLSTLACFLLGLLFPREGKTARTLLRKLTYSVHNFMLPIYFGFVGFQFDVLYFMNFENIIMIGLMILLSTGGKIVGTLAACRYLNIPRTEGVILAFILNLKGHTELIILELLPRFISWWSRRLHSLVIIVVVLDTLIAGLVVVFMLRTRENYFAHRYTELESHDPDSELRVLSCVYASRHTSATVGLISAMSGTPYTTPIAPYLMHLVELPKKRRKTKLMYHQLQDGDQFSDEEEYGGNDVLEINDVVDAFVSETKIMIHQRKVVASYERMYEDVCSGAEDLRVSIIFIHLHKHQRIDEKLENGKEGVRSSNQKILRHAPCSVGMLVDRGHTGFKKPGPEIVQEVAILFFGGPDDREALTCSNRIAIHPYLKLTVIRFLPTTSKEQLNKWTNDASHKNDEVLLAISDPEAENEMNDAALGDFVNSFLDQACEIWQSCLYRKVCKYWGSNSSSFKRSGRQVLINHSREG